MPPHQQRAGNTRQRHEEQNSNQHPVTGIADSGCAVCRIGSRNVTDGEHGEADHRLRGAGENSRRRRIHGRADADEVGGVKLALCISDQRHGSASDKAKCREHNGDVEEAERVG